MLRLRKARYRRHPDALVRPHEIEDPLADGFGDLEILNEYLLPPGWGINNPLHDAEVVTYVFEGTIHFKDSLGTSGRISAGEFQRRAAGRGIRHVETNHSPIHSAQVFQIWLRSCGDSPLPGIEQKRIYAADRRGTLRVVASFDARGSSLRLNQDALVCSAILHRGQHLIHPILPGRGAWLHVVHGQVTIGTVSLTTGDGAGISHERVLSFTAQEATEVLMIDLGGTLSVGVEQPHPIPRQ